MTRKSHQTTMATLSACFETIFIDMQAMALLMKEGGPSAGMILITIDYKNGVIDEIASNDPIRVMVMQKLMAELTAEAEAREANEAVKH